MTDRWGASEDEWAHFDLILGLGANLLPVVSNPGATLAPNSTLKTKGKVPSTYNRGHQVVGVPKWPERQSSPGDLGRWGAEPDLGIFMQARTIRAFDIDVPDPEKSAAIRAMIEAAVGPLPCRMRRGTGKLLLAFRCLAPDGLRKDSFKTEGGLVERLADGNGWVAAGGYINSAGVGVLGERYEWEDGLPGNFPLLALDEVLALWKALGSAFSTELPREERGVKPRSAVNTALPDPVAEHLEANGLVLGYGDGMLYVDCPWKSGHSVDSGETETAWLVAGTHGFEQGHMRCLHASCAGRTDEDFRTAIGCGVIDGFECVEVVQHTNGKDRGADAARLYAALGAESGVRDAAAMLGVESGTPWPALVRDTKGRIEATVTNLRAVMGRSDFTGYRVRYDRFGGVITWAAESADAWAPIQDHNIFELRCALERRGFKPVSREMARDAIGWAAAQWSFDSAQDWLRGLPAWDGVERCAPFFSKYFGARDSDYCRAVGLYFWSALAGRVDVPGIKADMSPVLIGEQGRRKSSGVEAVAPFGGAFAKINLTLKDSDLSRKLRGLLVGEIAELRGLHSRDAESIRDWLTFREERWTPKYVEHETSFMRRCVFVGTGNLPEFLADETGERRWLPLMAGVVGDADPEGIERDREQLWAEGLAVFRGNGVLWRDAERLARAEHAAFKIVDESWEAAVQAWLDQPSESLGGGSGECPGDREITTAEVLAGALNLTASKAARADEMRLARVLKGLGWEKHVAWREGKTQRFWQKITNSSDLA